LSLGVSDHAAGPELVPLLDADDAGVLDAVIVRQKGSRRRGEKLTENEFDWFALLRLKWRRGQSLQLAPPCGVRVLDRGPASENLHNNGSRLSNSTLVKLPALASVTITLTKCDYFKLWGRPELASGKVGFGSWIFFSSLVDLSWR
jgi:hypothetical protein